jgi:DNA polymerase I-like protein with 3'-5' exonuclease and polymerase domains
MNIPYKGRRFIIPPDGHFFLYPDMDQIEARCMAVLSKDPKLTEIFARAAVDPDTDFHTEVMDMIKESTGFDFNSIDVGPHAGQGRFFSKKTSYAKFYGIRAAQLTKELGVDELTATKIIRAYDKTFVGIPIYHDAIASQMGRDRTWRSPTGRFRRFLDRIIDKSTGMVHYEYLKKGWSGPPQDMAAKVLAEGLFNMRKKYPHLLTPLVHVHDALLISAELSHKHEAVAAVRECLTITEWDMQFTCGVSVGPNWYIASLDDDDKMEAGFEDWTLENFLRRD